MNTTTIPPLNTIRFHPDGTPNIDNLLHDTITRGGHNYMHRYFIHRDYNTWSTQIHHILTDDPEPDPHDHPWDFTSILLTGAYIDHSPAGPTTCTAPCIITRRAETPHHLELIDGPVWTLVNTGPVRRRWGYHTTRGWVPWRDYQTMHPSA